MNIQLNDKKQIYSGPTKLTTPELVLVCIAIALPGCRDRFFVLTEGDIQKVCVAGYTSWMDSIGWQRPRNPSSLDCRWSVSDIQQFEDRWELILGRLQAPEPDSSLGASTSQKRDSAVRG